MAGVAVPDSVLLLEPRSQDPCGQILKNGNPSCILCTLGISQCAQQGDTELDPSVHPSSRDFSALQTRMISSQWNPRVGAWL